MKKNDIKSVFFGTSRFSVLVLEELKNAGLLPVLIVTAPDTKQGRKLILTPPPSKVWAEEEGIDYVQPEHIDENFISELQNTDWDIFFTASYGKILPQKLLDIPTHGSLNVHPSLLPKYRGSSPIHSNILADDRETGITIMLMDDKLDHGPIVTQARIEIDENDWPMYAYDLEELLGVEGGKLLAEITIPWMNGEIKPSVQIEEEATFTKKISKENGELDLENGNGREHFLKMHAYGEWPGIYFFTKRNAEQSEKRIRVKITNASYINNEFKILSVIPEGKKEMLYEDFLRG